MHCPMSERTKDYRKKRDFGRTPEPPGDSETDSGSGALRFVIQKHDATRLHFDLRLEWDGVYKSWAVTNEPTSEVGSRRLAVHVEDHPLEYGTFEGEIPEGNYGAGSVIIWDSGTWIPDSDPAEGLREGKLSFVLNGSVLHGRWTLVRFGQRSLMTARKDNWLLIKRHDDPKPRSQSGAVKRPMGETGSPQLATLVTDIPAEGDWWFEQKLDGYRLLARIEHGEVTLTTRNGHNWTDRFPQIAASLADLPCEAALLDGEVVVFDAAGVSHFQGLQNALSTDRGAMHYVVFDLIHLDEWDLRKMPLSARVALLRQLISETEDPIRFSDHLEGDGTEILRNVCELGLEGIIAKRPDAPYVHGRSKTWLKLKCAQEQEFIVVGYTDPGGARTGFGALLLATRDEADGPLIYAGRVGTGFDQVALSSLRDRLESIEVERSPVPGLTRRTAGNGVHWVAPALVAQVSFAGWTSERRIRHANFHGLREDKDAREVVLDQPKGVEPVVIEKKRVRLTNPDKLLFTDPDITKRDLAEYWKKVAPLALPYIAGRPLSLLRCPDGITSCFYQKHVGSSAPDGIVTVAIAEGEDPYAMVEDAHGFAALVQWGTIEVHTWGSRAERLDTPDTLVFDLDPADGIPWSAVIDGAEELKRQIEALGLVPFFKLTGGKGLHLVIPVVPGPTWDAVKKFARALATDLARAKPDRYTVSISKAKRGGKIFIDYLRNDREATAIAPYSPRAREGAPIAVPITWANLIKDRSTRPVSTIADLTSILRSHKRSHPWKAFEDCRRSLT